MTDTHDELVQGILGAIADDGEAIRQTLGQTIVTSHTKENRMTTLDLTTRLVTVPKHRDSLTHAIEKAGLDYVSAVVSCYDGRTGLTDVYEITGIPRHDDDLNRLDVTLTADQYRLLQVTLRRAQIDPARTSVHSLEVERLVTIFAEAAAPCRKDTA